MDSDGGGRKRKYTLIGMAVVLVVGAAVGTFIGVRKHNRVQINSGMAGGMKLVIGNTAAKILCKHTDFKAICEENIASPGNKKDPKELVKVTFNAAAENVQVAIEKSVSLKVTAQDPRASNALDSCKDLLDTSIDDLKRAFNRLDIFDITKMNEFAADLRVWLSGAVTFQETCLDAFENTTGDSGVKMRELLQLGGELTRNSLAMMDGIADLVQGLKQRTSIGRPGLDPGLDLGVDLGLDDGFMGTTSVDVKVIAGNRRMLEGADVDGISNKDLEQREPGGSRFDDPGRVHDPNRPRGLEENPLDDDRHIGRERVHVRLQENPLDDDRHIGRERVHVRLQENPLDDDRHIGRERVPVRLQENPLDDDRHIGRERVPVRLQENPLDDDRHIGRERVHVRLQENPLDDDRHRARERGHVRLQEKPLDDDRHIGRERPHARVNVQDSKVMVSQDDNGVHYPSWVDGGRRALINIDPKTIKPNAVVAQDGSGNYKTIMEAVNLAPKKGTEPFIIMIKAGIYNEYIVIPRHINNVVFLGEGGGRTKITGNKNYIDGVGTYQTATVAVNGDGFMAKDIWFENSAGPQKHQAVALRVSADMTIFHNCAMDGYQDTLYAHSYRQFYRQCTITGTIDFLFGDAAAIFQDCKMIVRKPMDNQACMVTAQGRKDSHSVGGLVLQGCTISAAPDFMNAVPMPKSYLGRPWKEFSRTIIMQTFIDKNIVPQGWSEWAGTFALDTCYYAEFQNKGPSADTRQRVQWKGIKKITPQEAETFTPAKYIQGDAWIPAAGVPYDPGMMKI